MSEKTPPEDRGALDQARQLGHEWRDVNVQGVVVFAAGLITLIALALGAMYWLALAVAGPNPSGPTLITSEQAPAIFDRDVQANQRLLREADEQVARETLASYAWIDRQQGIARVPVERAMELLAANQDASLRLPAPAAGEASESASGAAAPSGPSSDSVPAEGQPTQPADARPGETPASPQPADASASETPASPPSAVDTPSETPTGPLPAQGEPARESPGEAPSEAGPEREEQAGGGTDAGLSTVPRRAAGQLAAGGGGLGWDRFAQGEEAA